MSLRGNVTSDSSTSAVDEATGLLTVPTVYAAYEEDDPSERKYPALCMAALVVYGTNLVLRSATGLRALLFPEPGARIRRRGRLRCCGKVRAVVGGGLQWVLRCARRSRDRRGRGVGSTRPHPALTRLPPGRHRAQATRR